MFLPPPSSTAVGVEGESLQVSLSAKANPITVLYSWTKDGLPVPLTSTSNGGVEHRIYADGANLNFTKLNRNDAGIYVCEASNSEGSAKLNITIVVECEYTTENFKSKIMN